MERITTPFGAHSTADEVIGDTDLTGKRIIVTGGASGIGTETARVLARAGAEITLAVRDVKAGLAVAEGIAHETVGHPVHVRRLDLADQASVRSFVAEWTGPLHVLVNNAGVMALQELTRTPEGWEMQFATNFLGHFALTLGLHRALAAAGGARIVSVSSSAHLMAPVIFGDPHFDFLAYTPFSAYGQSKTANVLLAVEATRRWSTDGIFANALHPGAIATNLQRHTGGMKTPPERRKTIPEGAATSVLLAASPLLEGIGGRFFEDCNEAPVVTRRPEPLGGGVAPYAIDPANATRLWEMGLSLVEGASL
jgi:NAD(P)-dependent dehydrogenase (short-subunit alcohol dehydrogenase family)